MRVVIPIRGGVLISIHPRARPPIPTASVFRHRLRCVPARARALRRDATPRSVRAPRKQIQRNSQIQGDHLEMLRRLKYHR